LKGSNSDQVKFIASDGVVMNISIEILKEQAGENSKLWHLVQFKLMENEDMKAIEIDMNSEKLGMLFSFLCNKKANFGKFRHRRERECFREELEFWQVPFNKQEWAKEDEFYPVECFCSHPAS
jgi:hypothetical protein